MPYLIRSIIFIIISCSLISCSDTIKWNHKAVKPNAPELWKYKKPDQRDAAGSKRSDYIKAKQKYIEW